MRKWIAILICALMLFSVLVSCGQEAGQNTETESDTSEEIIETGKDSETAAEPGSETETKDNGEEPMKTMSMTWTSDHVFPTFSRPDGVVYSVSIDNLGTDELITVTCLQGIINANDTRLVIIDSDVKAWLDIYGIKTESIDASPVRFEKFKEFASEIKGVVLYDKSKSVHYENLACSVAGILRGIPMTKSLYRTWTSKGVDLPVIEDLTSLELTKPEEIYDYYYENYWFEANQRLILVQKPGMYQMRDLAAATGSPVIYLSCEGNEETEEYRKFLLDMTPGASIVTGWYADQERELMTVSGKCGISVVPSDYFSNPTVFAQPIQIQARAVPQMPELENKIYIAFYFSDGDNIQYDMHAMYEYWRMNTKAMGYVPVNWTISPSLADVAPGMMNYYYSTAPDNVCFVSGPSGMGYTMPVNTFGASVGDNFPDSAAFKAYVELTNTYLQRTGLRAVTIWDNLTDVQREIYTSSAPYLYGLTVQNFTSSSLRLKYTGVRNNKLIQQMTPAYFAKNAEGTTPLNDIMGHIKDAVSYLGYDGTFPVFVSAQVSVWAFHLMYDVRNLEKALNEYYASYGEHPVEFVRADHYFNLYRKANGLSYDLKLDNAWQIAASSGADKASLVSDGSCGSDHMWTAETSGEQSLTIDLGGDFKISEITVYHAGTAGLDPALNTKDFRIEISSDGTEWRQIGEVTDNDRDSSTVSVSNVRGAYLRIVITDPGSDGVARISDIDVLGLPG